MSALPARITIATRESALALWQAEHVRARLRALHPGCSVELLGLTTRGDRILDQPLAAIGGKGLFIKELEQAMEAGEADCAVHSLKDVPMDMPEGFVLAAISAREEPRDAFVSVRHASLADLPAGAVVGTSSLRREAQLRERHPRLVVRALRGNVNTRLRKLDEGQYDAVILAAAGLIRLGFTDRIRRLLDPEESLPAVGQGALGIECRADRADLIALLAPLHDSRTAACVLAERALSRALAGSCNTPLAGFAEWRDGQVRLRGLIANRDGTRVLRGEALGSGEDSEAIGGRLAADLRARGADAILRELESGA